MKVHFPASVTGQKDTLVVLEVEFTSKARRVIVQGFDGLEPLDLKGEKAGGTYEVMEALPRLHVPMRVTRTGPGKGRGKVRVEDAKGVIAPEEWDGAVTLEAPVAGTGKRNKAWILTAFVAIVAAIAVFVVAPLFESPRVPSLLGKPQEEAQRAIKSLGYYPQMRVHEENDASREGLVVGQVPDAGTDLPRGSTVEILVGHRTEAGVVVPDLTDATVKGLSDAEALATKAGFTLTYVREEGPDDQAGKVLRQKPTAGARAPQGSAIELVIGQRRAIAERDVPDVTALSPAEAERTLAEAKFQVAVKEEDSGPDKAGKVLRQTPAGGTKAAENSKVELVVGREAAAPALVEMPDTVAKGEADAVKALTDAGFVPHVTYGNAPAGSEGKVLAQTPPAGMAPRGG